MTAPERVLLRAEIVDGPRPDVVVFRIPGVVDWMAVPREQVERAAITDRAMNAGAATPERAVLAETLFRAYWSRMTTPPPWSHRTTEERATYERMADAAIAALAEHGVGMTAGEREALLRVLPAALGWASECDGWAQTQADDIRAAVDVLNAWLARDGGERDEPTSTLP